MAGCGSQFCVGCPIIPNGVMAVLTGVEAVTVGARVWLHIKVVSSTSPNVNVDDETSMLVDVGQLSADVVPKMVRCCKGPARNWWMWLIGIKAVCGCFGPQH